MPLLNEKLFRDEYLEYSEILKYVSAFQINMEAGVLLSNSNLHSQSDTPSSQFYEGSKRKLLITVFKKKNLKKVQPGRLSDNIYNHTLSNPDIDISDPGRSKVSCLRCRKFKKKCSRVLPECSNCLSSEELCTYLPRKPKGRKRMARCSPDPVQKIRSHLNHGNNVKGIDVHTTWKNESVDAVTIHRQRLSLPNLTENIPLVQNSQEVVNAFDESKIMEDSLRRKYSSSSSETIQSDESYSYLRITRHSNDFGLILN